LIDAVHLIDDVGRGQLLDGTLQNPSNHSALVVEILKAEIDVAQFSLEVGNVRLKSSTRRRNNRTIGDSS
jgi:hypothetical protein